MVITPASSERGRGVCTTVDSGDVFASPTQGCRKISKPEAFVEQGNNS
jgi:hypothetical protein